MVSMADKHVFSNPRRGSTRQNASSHIPVPISRHKVKEIQPHHHMSAPEPSRLLIMQNQYQQQLLREKKAKLFQMYQDINQDTALGRITESGANRRGIVRDFLKERRVKEQTNLAPSLNRTEHFQRRKRQNQGDLGRLETEKEKQLHRANSERILSQHQRTGLSRSNPLSPIKKKSQSMNNLRQQRGQDMLYNEPSDQSFGCNRRHLHVQFSKRLSTNNKTQTQRDVMPHKTKRGSKAQIKLKSKPATAYSNLKGEGEKPVTSRSKKYTKQPDKLKKLRHYVKPKSEPSRFVYNTGFDRSKERKPHSQPNKKNAIPKPKWKPHSTYSLDEDKSHQLPPKTVPKVAQVKRKQDRFPNVKGQSGSTNQMYDFQEWTNWLERYNKKFESRQGHGADRDMKERKAKQQQKKKKLDKMHVKELKKLIARNQLELSMLDRESDSEPSLPPLQLKPKPFSQTATGSYYGEFVDLDLKGCPICGRQFARDRLNKHAKVCQNAAVRTPRKVFDARNHRLGGTTFAAYVEHGKHKQDERPKKKSNWREKHNELIHAMQDARKFKNHVAKGGNPRSLPPLATKHSDYQQCPHCQRRFDPAVAKRHIPKHKEIKSRPPPPPPKKIGRRSNLWVQGTGGTVL